MGFIKQGPNTLIVSGASFYTGATTINAGTLQFNDGATLGTGNVTNYGGLVFNYSTGTTTVTNNIGGTGTLTKSGLSTVVLTTGSLTYTGRTTVTAGTLEAIGAGGLGLVYNNGGIDIQGGQAVLDYTGLSTPSACLRSRCEWDNAKRLWPRLGPQRPEPLHRFDDCRRHARPGLDGHDSDQWAARRGKRADYHVHVVRRLQPGRNRQR